MEESSLAVRNVTIVSKPWQIFRSYSLDKFLCAFLSMESYYLDNRFVSAIEQVNVFCLLFEISFSAFS